MLTTYHIRLLIEKCREMSREGLLHERCVAIPPLEIYVAKPGEFLGTPINSAIFVSSGTYKQLKKFHPEWEDNRTLVFKYSLLKENEIDVIGVAIHETGHAFNVWAKIPNTEANAYIYEIEVMRKLLAEHSPLLFGCSLADVHSYFRKRLAFYRMERKNNEVLDKLIQEIMNEFHIEEKESELEVPEVERISSFIELKESLFANHLGEEPLQNEQGADDEWDENKHVKV